MWLGNCAGANRRSMARIVLAMIEPPLPFGNAAARWYYVLLRGLVRRGHAVTAFAACSNSQDISQVQRLFSSPQYDLRCYPTRTTSSFGEKIESFIRPM